MWIVLITILIGLYGLATFWGYISNLFKRGSRYSIALLIAGYAFHLFLVIFRWYSTGHIPALGSYENALFGSFFIPTTFLVMFKKIKEPVRFLPFVSIATLIMLSFGINPSSEINPLPPAFQSGWIYIHIIFAWLSWGSYLIASVIGGFLIYLLYKKKEKRPQLEKIIKKLILFGFPAQGLMIVSGAIWAKKLWGSYWNWDPIETWSLISWMIYGLYLHLRLTLKFRYVYSIWYVVIAILTNIIYFWGVGFVPKTHTMLL